MQTTKNINSPSRRFFAELVQRRVLQIGGTYIAGAWATTEIFSFLFEQFLAPDWAYRLMAILLVVGFPISMVLAWIIQVSEEGHWEIDHTRGDTRTLAVAIAIGLLTTAGLSWLILPHRDPPPVFEPIPASVAVWHFSDPGMSPDDQALANRLYRSLMTGLEQSPELTLVRLEQGEQPENLLTFGRMTGVESLVYGLLTQSAVNSNIGLQMLDVRTGKTIWSETYAWDEIQNTHIALVIANIILQSKALPTLKEREFRGTGHNEAYEAFLEGMVKATSPETGQLAGAIESFQTAIDIDRGFEMSYVGLAQAVYDLIGTNTLSDSEQQALEQRAHRAVDMARRLDKESADAMSLYALQLDNSLLRKQAWERALELDPDHYTSYYRYAMQMKEDGKLVDAEGLLRSATRFSPMNVEFRKELAAVLNLQGRNGEAQAELARIAKISGN